MISPVAVLLLAPLALPLQVADPFPPADPASVGVDPAALTELSDVVQSWVDEGRAVGAELLFVQSRRTVLHRAYGLRDVESGAPMQIGTRFNLRSMTKTLTGAAAQILIDEGELSLDDEVADFLPSFDHEGADRITVGQLLEHRSGLPLTMITTSVRQYPTLRALADAAGEKGPDNPPGQRFWYSDAGTEVLGAVVEVVSGMLLDEFVQERLLGPIGMTDTGYRHDAEPEPVETSRLASVYLGRTGSWNRFWCSADAPLYPFAWGSQSLYGTPVDYARFLAMWMDHGRVGEEDVLSEEAVARTLLPVSEMSMLGSTDRFPTSFRGLEVYYGRMAVLHCPKDAAERRAVIVGHSGSDGTIAWAWPEEDRMVLYFTQSRGGQTPLDLEAELERLFVHPGEAPPELSAELRDLVGSYRGTAAPLEGVVFEIAERHGRLALRLPGRDLLDLGEPGEDGWFPLALTSTIQMQFERNEAGEVVALHFAEGEQRYVLSRVR